MKEKEKRICSVCGAEIVGDDVCEFDDKVMCRECFERGTTTCDCCGIRIWSDDVQGDSSVTLCNRCYEYNYTTCEGCGRLISNDDAMYEDDSDYPYCESCYERIIKSAIKSYNYKPEPVFYGSGDLFMGVELEIDKGGENNKNAEVLINIANNCNEHIYCKHDGSIENGFEMVTHPMTLEYHLNNMNWGDILNILPSGEVVRDRFNYMEYIGIEKYNW